MSVAPAAMWRPVGPFGDSGLRRAVPGRGLKVQEGGAIRGTLKHSERLGNETFAYVNSSELGEITARMDGTLAIEPGATIELGFAAEHLYRFNDAGRRV